MTDIPKSVAHQMRESLLGRIQLNLYELISGRKGWMPEASVMRHYVLQEWRSHPEIARLFTHLLGLRFAQSITYEGHKDPADVKDLLRRLEQHRLKEFVLLEIGKCPNPLPALLGACIYCQTLAEGGLVYVVTLVDESFP